MKYLKPIINKPQYWQPLEKELMYLFSEIIYKPLIGILELNLGKDINKVGEFFCDIVHSYFLNNKKIKANVDGRPPHHRRI